MTIEGLEQLKRHEGFRGKPYKCPAGKWTVGYGHNLENDGLTEEDILNVVVSKETAHNMLVRDVLEAEKYLKGIFPRWQYFSPRRQDALANIMFNVGIGTFKQFRTVINGINKEDWNYVAERLEVYKWYRDVKLRAKEIVSMIRDG